MVGHFGLIGTPLAFDLVSRTIIDLIRQCIIFWRHFTASWGSSYETLLRSSLIKSASWASRYVTICRYMKPFNSYLHRLRLSQGLTNLHAQKKVDSTTYQIIQLWTMFLTLMNPHPTKIARSFESFSPLFVGTFINLDASLTGIGMLVYRVCMSGSLSLHVLSSFDTPYICSIVIQVINIAWSSFLLLCAIMLCIRTGISHAGL
jgi:hypothetical protein